MDAWRYRLDTVEEDGQTAIYLLRSAVHRDVPPGARRSEMTVILQSAVWNRDEIAWEEYPEGDKPTPLVVV